MAASFPLDYMFDKSNLHGSWSMVKISFISYCWVLKFIIKGPDGKNTESIVGKWVKADPARATAFALGLSLMSSIKEGPLDISSLSIMCRSWKKQKQKQNIFPILWADSSSRWQCHMPCRSFSVSWGVIY